MKRQIIGRFYNDMLYWQMAEARDKYPGITQIVCIKNAPVCNKPGLKIRPNTAVCLFLN